MRNGFTLLELVIVILTLGILAGVAAPRAFNTAESAADNQVRQSLAVVRDAIEVYRADHNGALPGADGNQATFKADLAPYLRRFPVLAVGPGPAQDDQVAMDASVGAVSGVNVPEEGWRYYYNMGTFIVNSTKPMKSDSSIQYDDL